jgi:hypothetical protein
MKTILSFVTFSSLLWAVEPQVGTELKTLPREMNSRICGLEFVPSYGTSDLLSGYRLNKDWVLTVGHTEFESGTVNLGCGVEKEEFFRAKKILRPDSYSYNSDPKTMSEWSSFDVGLVKLVYSKPSEFSAPLVIGSTELIRSLIMGDRCYVSGASNPKAYKRPKSALLSRVKQVTTTQDTVTHLLIGYEGSPVTFKGDSGGTLFCETDRGFGIAGLIQYGGKIEDKITKSKINALGVILLRPELIEWIQKKTSISLLN